MKVSSILPPIEPLRHAAQRAVLTATAASVIMMASCHDHVALAKQSLVASCPQTSSCVSTSSFQSPSQYMPPWLFAPEPADKAFKNLVDELRNLDATILTEDDKERVVVARVPFPEGYDEVQFVLREDLALFR